MDETGLPDDVSVTPEVRVKPQTDVGFFLLGLISPFVIWAILIWLGTTFLALTSVMLGLGSLPFFVFLWLALKGKGSGNVRLWSYGKGGMWAHAGIALLVLVAFGSCLVSLQS